MIIVHSDAPTNFLVEPLNFTIAYVDFDIAGKRVGRNTTQQFSSCWPGDNKLRISIVSLIIDVAIVSIVNAAIASLPDSSQTFQELRGFLEQPYVDGGLPTSDVTSIFNNTTAAGWVKAVMKLANPTLFWVTDQGHLADTTSSTQMPMHGSHSNIPLDELLPLPAELTMDNNGEESDDDAEPISSNCNGFLGTIGGSSCLKGIFKGQLSCGRDTLKSFETELLFAFPIMSKALLLKRMWPGYVSTTRL